MLRKSLKEIGSKSSFAKFAEDNIVNKVHLFFIKYFEDI